MKFREILGVLHINFNISKKKALLFVMFSKMDCVLHIYEKTRAFDYKSNLSCLRRDSHRFQHDFTILSPAVGRCTSDWTQRGQIVT